MATVRRTYDRTLGEQRLHKQELPFCFPLLVCSTASIASARGFDQAEVLAEMVGRAIGGEVVPFLRRIVKTASRAVAQSDRRLGELINIFAASRTFPSEFSCVMTSLQAAPQWTPRGAQGLG